MATSTTARRSASPRFTCADLEELLAGMDQVARLKQQEPMHTSQDTYDDRVANGKTTLLGGADLDDLGICIDDEVWVVLADPSLPERMRLDVRSEADRRVTDDDRMHWTASPKTASPKYGDGEFETAPLTCQDVGQLLGRSRHPLAALGG